MSKELDEALTRAKAKHARAFAKHARALKILTAAQGKYEPLEQARQECVKAKLKHQQAKLKYKQLEAQFNRDHPNLIANVEETGIESDSAVDNVIEIYKKIIEEEND